jgi:hypothetical protein
VRNAYPDAVSVVLYLQHLHATILDDDADLRRACGQQAGCGTRLAGSDGVLHPR